MITVAFADVVRGVGVSNVFVCKEETAYGVRMRDMSSDVCNADTANAVAVEHAAPAIVGLRGAENAVRSVGDERRGKRSQVIGKQGKGAVERSQRAGLQR